MANITSGGLSGGYLTYLRNMIPRLQQDARISRLDVFVPPSALDSFASSNGTLIRAWPRLKYGDGNIASLVHSMRPDLVFIPTARWADFGGIPVTAMVHNMEPLVTPFGGNSLIEASKNLVRRHTARITCARAQRVIAVSSFVREFLRSKWAVNSDKIGVVYHGVEKPHAGDPISRPPALARLRDDEPFLFTAGSIRPARGLDDLVGAMRLLAGRDKPIQVVIAGAATPDASRYRERVLANVEAAGLSARFFWAGSLNRAEMAWCFRRCSAFVMTTRAEACPMTALEALAYGTFIISSDTPPMPEILGDTALYYRAREAADLSLKIVETLAMSATARKDQCDAAAKRAARFDWDVTARRTVDELLESVNAHTGGVRS